MTKKQVEEFAIGYPYPTEYVEIILKKYNYDKIKSNEILCMSYNKVIKEMQII